MIKTFCSFLRKNLLAITLILISLIVCYKNFSSGTWLTGWDTLHPEFDFQLNLKRLFFGVWREEQGLGALAAHSHMADLSRALVLTFFSVFLSTNLLRYFYFFSCLVLGPLGVYHFLEKIILKNKNQKKPTCFLGALFYLLNLGTLQHFYVPFEMFAAQYALLPWLFHFAAKFLTENNKNNLLWFLVLSFLATPMAYAATLWYVYFAGLVIFSFTYSLLLGGFKKLKKPVVLVLITLLINLFWLLPNLYFMATSAQNVPQAKINQLFSEDAFAHDIKYATIENAAILKGFLFDWQEYSNGAFRSLLNEWEGHLQRSFILGIGYIFFLLILIGLFSSMIKRKRVTIALLPVFLFSFAFLTYSGPPLAYLFSILRDRFSIFKEGIRFPWTKFSILVMFCYSIYFAVAGNLILSWLKKRKILVTLTVIFLTLSLFLWIMPAFSGHLISPTRRKEIPNEYFELHSWFKKQNLNERIAQFPMPTFWGWEYYKWGFEGAGFLWFGLNQPFLLRDFDRWHPSNENFYWEASYALYSDNLSLLESVLEKYQVTWLIVDENIINPPSPKALYLDELKELISKSSKISIAQEFGKIKIYQVELETPVKNFTLLAKDLPQIEPAYNWNNYDQAYLDNGTYLSDFETWDLKLDTYSYYPFRSLFTGKKQENNEFSIESANDYFMLRVNIPKPYRNYQLILSDEFDQEIVFAEKKDLSKTEFLQPEATFDGKTIVIKIPEAGGLLSANINPFDYREALIPNDCDQTSRGIVKNELIEIKGNKFLRLKSLNTKNCSPIFNLPSLPHQYSYLISIENRNIDGKSLLFWLENHNSRKPDIETHLPKNKDFISSYFIQPPMEEDGLGYTLHFDSISIGNEKTTNDLGKITVNPFPFKFLTSLKLVNPQTRIGNPKLSSPEEVYHPNPSQYTVRGSFEPNQILILSQAHHDGWLAWEGKPIIGNKLNHVLVNNWENGWVIEEGNKPIYILFWPQLLEYFGFMLLLGTLVGVGYYLIKK